MTAELDQSVDGAKLTPAAERPDMVRHLVRETNRGDVLLRVLSFPAPGWVRLVVEGELQRSGFTLDRREAVELRDALSAALAELEPEAAAA